MEPQAYLMVAAILFVLGVQGFILRRNMIIILMSIELMLNAGSLSLAAFARSSLDMDAHVVVFLAMALAAAESAVGLAIVISVFRLKRTVSVDDMSIMKG